MGYVDYKIAFSLKRPGACDILVYVGVWVICQVMILSPQDFYCFLGILLQLKQKREVNQVKHPVGSYREMKNILSCVFQKSNYFGFSFIVEYVNINFYTYCNITMQ